MSPECLKLKQSPPQLGLSESPIRSVLRLLNQEESGDPKPWGLPYPHCLPPSPLPVLIALGILRLISSHLLSLLTSDTVRKPGHFSFLQISWPYNLFHSFSWPYLFTTPSAWSSFPVPLELTGSHQQDPLYLWPPLWMLHLPTLTVNWLFPEGTTLSPPPPSQVVTISPNIP